LITWTSGAAPAVSLGIVDGASGTLSTNGNTIQFNVVTVALVWNGLINGSWDLVTSTNWTEDGNPTGYSNPKQAVLNDTATGETNVTLSGVINPEALTINNSALTYSLASSPGNSLGGNIRLGKRGSSTLILSGGANTNTGVTTLRGGTTVVSALANGGSASDLGSASSAASNLVFNGGSLQYTGGVASIDRLFTVRGGGGTIDNEGTGPLTLNNPGVVNHGGRLTLNGNTADTNTLASALLGGGSLVKDGTGTWVLTGNNSYGGATTINNGVLQIGVGTGTGSLGSGPVVNDGAMEFNRTNTLTVLGAISGEGPVTKNGSGTLILANVNNYRGGTTINAGTLQVGNGGNAELYINGPIVNNATLTFTASGIHTLDGAGIISGPGNVIVNGSGRIKAIGANTYTGNTTIDGGGTLLPATFQPCQGQSGQLLSPLVTVANNGRLLLVRQDVGAFVYSGRITGNGILMVGANNDNAGDMTLLGTNDYSGGTFIGCQTLILGDGNIPVSGQIVGNVTFTNNFDTPNDNARVISFRRPDDFIFSGNITTNFATPQNNRGIVQKDVGPGTMILTGNNNYDSGTVVNAGFLVVGLGTNANGSLGRGPVALNSGNPLVINRTGTMTPFGNVSGAADVIIKGGVTVTMNGANNTYTGVTTVSNGTLIVNGNNVSSDTHVYAGGFGGAGTMTGPVTLEPGTTLRPGASVGTLTINNNFTNDASTFTIEVNRLLAPSNDIVNVSGTLARNVTGGTLNVVNLGPVLQAGDKFTVFSQPLPNGASVTVSGAGATWVNNLAVDGSITANTVPPTPTLSFIKTSTNTLRFSWDGTVGGYRLQAKTNSLVTGVWANYPGGATPPVIVPIVVTNSQAYFRLSAEL
jgi:autotransporter-associated beta strand protein